MTKDELIQIVKDEDPSLLGSDFIADVCAMHCDKPTEDEAISFDDNALNLCKEDKLYNSAKALVNEIAKFGMTCDTLASDRLHAFSKALIESGREQYAMAGHKIEKLDQHGSARKKSMTYALITIGNICSREAFDLENIQI